MLKFYFILVLALSGMVNSASAGDAKDQVRIDQAQTIVTTVCLSGFLFAVASSNPYFDARGHGTSIIQVFTEKQGKTVPKSCE